MADLLKEYQKMAEQARLSNLESKAQVEAIHNEIIKRYEPGGTFLARGEELIQAGKRKATGEQLHQLISSGLYGTTTPGALGQKYEQEVAAPARFKLEDVAMERLSSAQLGKASFLENIQYPYPDFGALTQAYAAQGGRGGGGTPFQGSSVTVDYGPPGMGAFGEPLGASSGKGYYETMRERYGGGSGGAGGTTSGGGISSYYSGIAGGYIPKGTVSPTQQTAGGGATYTGPSYTSTQPKGTGTISGPKGTTTIGPTGATTSGTFMGSDGQLMRWLTPEELGYDPSVRGQRVAIPVNGDKKKTAPSAQKAQNPAITKALGPF